MKKKRVQVKEPTINYEVFALCSFTLFLNFRRSLSSLAIWKSTPSGGAEIRVFLPSSDIYVQFFGTNLPTFMKFVLIKLSALSTSVKKKTHEICVPFLFLPNFL